jgi:DNA-binding transcriptional LysR family regulator
MELRELNLNLLLSLEALLDTSHVSKAAERLGVTQSAMSHALKQLRAHFDDPLLVRGAQGLVLTPRAERLAIPLRRAFAELRRGLSDADVDSSVARTFTIVAPDHLSCVLLPKLVQLMAKRAPLADLTVRSLEPRFFVEQLEVGEVDLVLSVETPRASALKAKRLFEDRFACAVRGSHPRAASKLSLAHYAALPHVVHSPSGRGMSGIDHALEARGLTRQIALRVPSLVVATTVAATTDHVVTAPRRFLEHLAPRLGLKVMAVPLELGRFRAFALWHERFDRDAAQRFLRECVVDAAKEHED